MGKIPGGPLELRLAATLFLLLIGLADLFGAWQVRNFSAFTPSGVADSVAPARREGHLMSMPGHKSHDMSMPGHEVHDMGSSGEKPISLEALDKPHHHIDQDLLVQDSHVHIPAYAMTAAFLSLIVLGLRLSSRARAALIVLAFAAPFLDFFGLWAAYLWSGVGVVWATVALAGGFLMGVVYLVVLAFTLWQCWFRRQGEIHA